MTGTAFLTGSVLMSQGLSSEINVAEIVFAKFRDDRSDTAGPRAERTKVTIRDDRINREWKLLYIMAT